MAISFCVTCICCCVNCFSVQFRVQATGTTAQLPGAACRKVDFLCVARTITRLPQHTEPYSQPGPLQAQLGLYKKHHNTTRLLRQWSTQCSFSLFFHCAWNVELLFAISLSWHNDLQLWSGIVVLNMTMQVVCSGEVQLPLPAKATSRSQPKPETRSCC